MVQFTTEMMIVIENMDDAIQNRWDLAGNFDETVCVSSTTRSQEVKPSPECKMIKVVTFLSCFRHYDVFAKTLSKMATAITFSRQNDAGSSARSAQYWESVILMVILILQSKGL